MYLPPQFNAKERSHALQVMRAYPFASLISCDDEGFPYVTHLPLHLEVGPETAASGTDKVTAEGPIKLLGHVAKPNPHWKFLRDRNTALVSFLGPHGYLSPKVYPDLSRVPTWNYLTVQCRVKATLIEDPAAKDRLLKKLIGDHEPPYADQWRSLGEAFAHKMLAGIVAFELDVTQLDCKLKLNQHRPEAHAAMRAAYAAGNDDQRALGEWMDRLGLAGAVAAVGVGVGTSP